MTWIYGGGLKYLLQCNASNIGWYFKARNFCILEKVSERQGGKNNSSPLSRNMCSSSHWFIKHSAVTIMLCCVSSIICQQTVFGYHRSLSSLSRHTSHTSYHPSGSGQLFVALCSPRIYRLSLSHRDLLTVMSVLGFHILYSSNDIKTVSKYNWILNVYSNLSVV